MASVLADIQTNAQAKPAVRTKANRLHGRIRVFQATVTPAAAVAIGETITWGSLPVGARVLGHLSKLYFSAGAASSTINLGDAVSAARHLAATSITSAGSAVPEAASAAGAQFETTDNNCTLISTVAGAGIPAGQVLTLTVAYVVD